ncbi:hypothetical protein L914_06660, partial [Phytophthora nicotianae]
TEGVLAHVVPPNILNGAVVLVAVDALHLVLADDGVLECGTGLHLEHGGVGSTLGLTLTRDVGALERLHLAVEYFTSLDHACLGILNHSGACWPRAIGDLPASRGTSTISSDLAAVYRALLPQVSTRL